MSTTKETRWLRFKHFIDEWWCLFTSYMCVFVLCCLIVPWQGNYVYHLLVTSSGIGQYNYIWLFSEHPLIINVLYCRTFLVERLANQSFSDMFHTSVVLSTSLCFAFTWEVHVPLLCWTWHDCYYNARMSLNVLKFPAAVVLFHVLIAGVGTTWRKIMLQNLKSRYLMRTTKWPISTVQLVTTPFCIL